MGFVAESALGGAWRLRSLGVAQSIDTDLPEDEEGAPIGCGRMPRESLELAAIARADCSIEVDERTSTHLVICKPCLEAVGQLAREHALLTELASAARPEPAAQGARSFRKFRPAEARPITPSVFAWAGEALNRTVARERNSSSSSAVVR